MADRLKGIDAKIKRAKKNIRDFEEARATFFASQPYSLSFYCDLESRRMWTAVNIVQELPEEDMGAIIGDVLGDLRAALDYLIHEITNHTGAEHLAFPISGNEHGFKAAIKGIKKLTPKENRAAMDLLRATKAYQGGEGHGLWQLNKLNDLNKHRLPLPVGCCLAWFELDTAGEMRRNFPELDWVQKIPSMPLAIRPSRNARNYPLKDGAVIFGQPSHMNMQTKFAFEIAFGEGQVMDGEPVLPTLLQFTELVEGTIKPFRTLLSN
jgi:hypothetical protein